MVVIVDLFVIMHINPFGGLFVDIIICSGMKRGFLERCKLSLLGNLFKNLSIGSLLGGSIYILRFYILLGSMLICLREVRVRVRYYPIVCSWFVYHMTSCCLDLILL